MLPKVGSTHSIGAPVGANPEVPSVVSEQGRQARRFVSSERLAVPQVALDNRSGTARLTRRWIHAYAREDVRALGDERHQIADERQAVEDISYTARRSLHANLQTATSQTLPDKEHFLECHLRLSPRPEPKIYSRDGARNTTATPSPAPGVRSTDPFGQARWFMFHTRESVTSVYATVSCLCIYARLIYRGRAKAAPLREF
jgi:hypothetical protein